MTIEKIEETRGVDVLQDWDNFFGSKMADYYTVKEEVIGDWFTWEAGVIKGEGTSHTQITADVKATRLFHVMYGSKRPVVIVGVVAGPGIQGNPYNLPQKKAYIVDVYDKSKGMFYTPQELTAFVELLSKNPYGAKYVAGPIVGLIDFKAAVQAVKDLPDGASTEGIEQQVLDSLNMLLHTPSTIDAPMDKRGILCSGLFGYTFNYN